MVEEYAVEHEKKMEESKNQIEVQVPKEKISSSKVPSPRSA